MAKMGMSPPRRQPPSVAMPPAAAFALLNQINEFLAFPDEDRAAVFEAFMEATQHREATEAKCNDQVAAAALDRVAAQSELHEAEQLAVQKVQKADGRSKNIIDSATAQAEAVTAQARENSMASRDEVAEAKETAKKLLSGHAAREIKVRENERRLDGLIKDCEKAETAFNEEKKVYRDLIDDINALQRKAPK